jgi:pimeloyl-ACP methyl ester carboxylesterase
MPFCFWQPTAYFQIDVLGETTHGGSTGIIRESEGTVACKRMPIDRRILLLGALSTSVPSLIPRSRAMNTEPSRYRIAVPDEVLSRITRRVEHVHIPKTSQGSGWKYGLDAAWLAELVDYWRSGFDWRKVETELNRVPQFAMDVEGIPIHFAWIKPVRKKVPVPFLLLHGWPYTFATMLPLGNRLADAGYEVVVPSLPGYGFSPAPDKEVRGLRFITARISALMQMLGYDRYLVHGGDHGAVMADWLAIDVPDCVAGVHVNSIGFRHAGAEFGTGKTGVEDATDEEKAYVKAEVAHMDQESAYFRLQSTRPESIIYALADSPVGWAAYMLDKWQKWTAGGPSEFVRAYTRDHLLTELMIYLVTDTVATSIWPYAGFALEPFGLKPSQTIEQPFGYSSFEDPLLPRMPRRFMERSRTNIKLWREHPLGGHFPMLTATDILAKDAIDFSSMV